jgi:hypothetical protein
VGITRRYGVLIGTNGEAYISGFRLFFSVCLQFNLVLHWRWIASVVAGRPREGSGLRVGLGIIGLLALVAFSISPLITPMKKNAQKANGSGILSSTNTQIFK